MTPATSIRWQLLALTLVIGAVIYLLAPVLTPFAIAAMFAYLFDPLADRLERWRLSRSAAVTVVFVCLTVLWGLVLLALVPYLQRQISILIQHLPDWFAWLHNDAVPWLNAKFDLSLQAPDFGQLSAVLQQHWKEAGGLAATLIKQVSKSGFALVSLGVHLVVVPVAFFYLLRDWDTMVERIRELLPRSLEPTVGRLAREVDSTLSGFVRGQVAVMIVLGVFYAVALSLVGLEVGPLIGMIAGLISFVPYLGGISGVLMGVVAAFVQYHDWAHAIAVLVVFAIGHLLEGYVLVPRLVGEKIGLHPLAVIFAVLAGGELFGFLGVLLALPIASVIMVLLRYAHERYRASALYASTSSSVATASGAVPDAPIAAHSDESTATSGASDDTA